MGVLVAASALILMKNRLKVLRAERDWSQADLADRLEVSRQTVNALETGKYDPSLPLAFKIARLFHSRSKTSSKINPKETPMKLMKTSRPARPPP
jgi:putative transcriptional regulator